MKIAFVSYAESHSNKWVNALVERGHEVFFIMQKSDVNHVELLNKKIQVIELPFVGKKGYILNAYSLRKIVNRIRPDVVNVHYASGYGTMARLAGIKKELLSVWGSDVYEFPYKNRLCMRIIKDNLVHANQLASTSNCMAEQVRKLISDEKKITITPFGINIDEFSPERFKSKHREKDLIVIGNIKALMPVYGIEDLIKAFDLLLNDLKLGEETRDLVPKLRCVVYGSGEQKDDIIKLIQERNLENFVHLLGEIKHTEVPAVLSEIDIFCATSISESFGVAVLEAEAMEVPVVVTDTDGFKEVVEDGVTGIIVQRKNIKQISLALKKLILDEQLRETMGKNGRKRAIEKYNFEDNVTTMEQIYFEIAKG